VAVLTFVLADERYALPLQELREVRRMGAITPIPGLPAAILGAIGRHGQVLPVLDLRRLLRLGEAAPTAASRLLVVQHQGTTAALLADQVEDIANLPSATLRPAPSRPSEGAGAFLQAIAGEGEDTVRLLDLARLLEAVRHGG